MLLFRKASSQKVFVFCFSGSYNIDQHDYSVRMRAARKFLQDGDKVKVIVNMKGRENEFRNIAIELLRRFQTEIGEVCIVSLCSFLIQVWYWICTLMDRFC